MVEVQQSNIRILLLCAKDISVRTAQTCAQPSLDSDLVLLGCSSLPEVRDYAITECCGALDHGISSQGIQNE